MPNLVSIDQAALSRVATDAKTTVLDAMGRAVTEEAVRLCPKDTGYLASTIHYTLRQSDNTVSIHADAKYAWFVEVGSRFSPAQPFLRPALLAARNWSNRKVSTELQFHAPETSANPRPTPRANASAVSANERINTGLGKRFKGLGSILHKRPAIVFHGKTARSQTGRHTHAIHERYGR